MELVMTQFELDVRVTLERVNVPLCDICGRVFASAAALRAHTAATHDVNREEGGANETPPEGTHANGVSFNKTHEKKQYPCSLCEKVLSSNSKLRTHNLLHMGLIEYKCCVCEMHFQQKGHLRDHIVRMHKTYKHICDVCHSAFEHYPDLQIHEKVHQELYKYRCDICNRMFERNVDMINHSNAHAKYPCKICKQQFESSEELNVHVHIHPCFQCDLCKRKFRHKYDLKKHLLNPNIHRKLDWQHEAAASNGCSNIFRGIEEKEAERSADGPQSKKENILYRCNTCGKTLKTKKCFLAHENQHKGLHPYTCEICGKGYSGLPSLNRHLRAHLNGHIYPCESCLRTFKSHTTLKNHELLHTKKCQHKCNICGAVFKCKSDVERHSIVHTRERPFQCDLCPKGFTSKKNLCSHMLAKHLNKRPFPCNLCPKFFVYKSQLRNHQLISMCRFKINQVNDNTERHKLTREDKQASFQKQCEYKKLPKDKCNQKSFSKPKNLTPKGNLLFDRLEVENHSRDPAEFDPTEKCENENLFTAATSYQRGEQMSTVNWLDGGLLLFASEDPEIVNDGLLYGQGGVLQQEYRGKL